MFALHNPSIGDSKHWFMRHSGNAEGLDSLEALEALDTLEALVRDRSVVSFALLAA